MRISLGRIVGWCRRNPFACAVFAIGTAAGAVSAVAFEIGPAEMATWKRALGGALAGAWLAMFPDEKNRPARHTVIDASLGGMVQIEAIAVVQGWA